jgi:hypothetical protein
VAGRPIAARPQPADASDLAAARTGFGFGLGEVVIDTVRYCRAVGCERASRPTVDNFCGACGQPTALAVANSTAPPTVSALPAVSSYPPPVIADPPVAADPSVAAAQPDPVAPVLAAPVLAAPVLAAPILPAPVLAAPSVSAPPSYPPARAAPQYPPLPSYPPVSAPPSYPPVSAPPSYPPVYAAVPGGMPPGNGRPAGWPSLAATVVVTFLFGVFGIIPALLHTEAVRRLGARTTRYWQAFGITLATSIVAYIVLIVVLLQLATTAADNLADDPGFEPGLGGGATHAPVGGINQTGHYATDASGDVTMSGGADLIAFSWNVSNGQATFAFAFAGPYSIDHNIAMYFRTSSSTVDNNCPGLPGADVTLTIDDGGVGTVSDMDPDGVCADRGFAGQADVRPTATGWQATVDASLLGLDRPGQVAARVLTDTQTGPTTETVIQDYFPDANQPPFILTIG